MAQWRSQAGDTRAGCFLWLVLLAIFVMIAWKVVPVKIKSAELQSFMEEQAQFAYHASPQALKKRILNKTKELGLPVNQKNIKVERRGPRIVLSCRYTVPLEFPFYTYNWNIKHLVDRPVFLV